MVASWASITHTVPHQRHYMGEVTPYPFMGYLETMNQFYREAEALRRSYEN
jgi:hypothetical protein